MKHIQMTKGYIALVDDEDFELVSCRKWYPFVPLRAAMDTVYAYDRNGILMHRLIMNPEKGIQVDHRNHNGLDNTRKNLRLCTSSQNHGNIRNLYKTDKSKSVYKGVDWSMSHSRWRARIANKHIGRFREEIEAAKAYDRAALAMFGEFANLNFPVDKP